MRRRSALLNGKYWLGAAAALWAAFTGGAALAQNPTTPPAAEPPLLFNGLDWLMDQGQANFFGPITTTSPFTSGQFPNGQRPGYNEFNNTQLPGNSPGPATFRWTFPFNFELPVNSGGTSSLLTVTVDNANPLYPQKIYFDPPTYTGNPVTFLSGGWTIPTGNDAAGIGGYPMPDVSPAAGYYQDYAYTLATHNDFTVVRAATATTPASTSAATDAELAALPNTPPDVYSAVHNTLLTTAKPVSIWTSGDLNLIAGRYSIRLYSPGAGRIDNSSPNNPIVSANVSRAFVRVSWGIGTTPNGSPNTNITNNPANPINDPVTSRIFEVNLETQQWIPITGGGATTSATFPYDGLKNDQIVVTLYSLTPDDVTASIFNGALPTVTADAVQFTLQPTSTTTYDPGLILRDPDGVTPQKDAAGNIVAIAPIGQILGAAVGTQKLAPIFDPAATTLANPFPIAEPLTYFARAEFTPDTVKRTYADPTVLPAGVTGPTTPDPTSPGGTVPVFYCIDNSNQILGYSATGATPQITSAQKVVWRYVADSDDTEGLSYASPLLTNVRCRDGILRPMLFFATSSSVGRSHIYALDPIGDRASHTTHAYWEYPAALSRPQIDDPNLPIFSADANYSPLYGAANGFGGLKPDQSIAGPLFPTAPQTPLYLYDQYLVPGTTTLDPNRIVPFEGVSGSPLLIDDPDNKTGPQLLIVPAQDGHIYAFDAGGRGDFGVIGTGYAPGTTQRIWTWPRLGVDREAFGIKPGTPTKLNPDPIVSDDSPLPNQTIVESFSTSPTTYDSASINPNLISPIVIGSDNGHLYNLFPGHENFTVTTVKGVQVLTGPNRLNWTFPDEYAPGTGVSTAKSSPKTPLGSISTVTVYKPGGNLNDEYLFTAAGRIYAVYATNNGNLASDGRLAWAYPNPTTLNNGYTNGKPILGDPSLFDPAVPDPNDANTTPLDTDFFAAPVVLKGVSFYPNALGNDIDTPPTLGTAATADLCYVLQSDGTLYAINALPQDNVNLTTTVYATNVGSTSPFQPGNTLGNAIATIITPDPYYFVPTTGDVTTAGGGLPALIFGDENGRIFAFGARPELSGTPGLGETNSLQLMMVHGSDEEKLPLAPRSAGAIVTGGDTFYQDTISSSIAVGSPHGLLLQGDRNGVMYAYGFGIGASGTTPTIPLSQLGTQYNQGDGNLDIDMRGVDVFRPDDWAKFQQTGGAGNSASPSKTTALITNLRDTKNGSHSFEWGDTVYLAAWGVYHAMPTNATDTELSVFGITAPQITVTFVASTGSLGSQQVIQTIVPVGIKNINTGVNGYASPGTPVIGNTDGSLYLWPDDTAANQAVSLYGTDPNDPNAKWNQKDSNGNLLFPGLAPTPTVLTSALNGSVFPWLAIVPIKIDPSSAMPFTPGTWRVTASAVVMQNLSSRTKDPNTGNFTVTSLGMVSSSTTQALLAGRTDADGRDTAAPQDPKPLAGRPLYIANPFALTTRGDGPGLLDQADYNALRFTADPGSLFNPGEVVANGNRVRIIATNQTYLKPIIAPMGSIESNTTGKYQGLGVNGLEQAFYVVDRSNYSRLGNGRRLAIKGAITPMGWRGGTTSVMNPLPWEQMPLEGTGSIDYPNLGTDAVTLRKSNGEDLLVYSDSRPPTLTPVTYTGGTDTYGYPARSFNEIPLSLSVTIPRYFPANMNFGTGAGIGLSVRDPSSPSSGVIYGDPTVTNTVYPDILGPLDDGGGLMVNRNTPYSNPSGGFIGSLTLSATVQGQTALTPGRQRLQNGRLSSAAASTTQTSFTNVIIGAGVKPTLKMTIQEQTVDLGKLSHGAGYSDPYNKSVFGSGLRVPFAPVFDASPLYGSQFKTNPDFWDNSQHSLFFRPFTLTNESNVNLVDVRLAKLISLNNNQKIGAGSLYSPAQSGYAQAVQIRGSDINDYGLNPLFTLGFGAQGNVGNIGIVTSLDHQSNNNNVNGTANYREISQFPAANSYVFTNDVMNWNTDPNGTNWNGAFAANNNQLIPMAINSPGTANQYYWSNGYQPQPTVHKARPGDGVGTNMTIPDVPYGQSNPTFPNSQVPVNPSQPLVGIAVPLGTPAGTYTASLTAFEDSTPIQLRIWQAYSGKNAASLNGGINHDGILNELSSGNGVITPEHFADPGLTLKFTVTETRLTNGASNGTLGQLDPISNPLLLDPLTGKNDLTTNVNSLTQSLGANLQPAAVITPMPGTNNGSAQITMYWTTNRQPMSSPFVDMNTGTPKPGAPWSLSLSTLNLPVTTNGFNFYDAAFARPAASGNPYDVTAQWWTQPTLFKGTGLTGNPATDLPNQFPNAPGLIVNGSALPYLRGIPEPYTERHGSPAATADGAYLFWQGTVDKYRSSGPQALQIRDSRTFYQPLLNGLPSGPTLSFLNDPAVTKLSPKPIRVTSGGIDMLFLFWHTGGRGNAALYYNVNTTAGFPAGGWSQDMKLPIPDGVAWQSDPSPVFRKSVPIFDPQTPDNFGKNIFNPFDCLDVAFTGVLRNRATTETLLSRYTINIDKSNVVTLNAAPLPTIMSEKLARVGGKDVYESRDVSWFVGKNTGTIKLLYFDPVKGVTSVFKPLTPTDTRVPIGRFDAASGLTYYDSVLGGQVVVDTRTGRISFPNVPINRSLALYVSYTPQVMRLSAGRDDTGAAFFPDPAYTSASSTYSPTMFIDKSKNPRNTNNSVDRMWVFYRKSDPIQGAVGSSIYYKAMRLMVRVPNYTPGLPLSAPGAVEVDKVRGLLFFTEDYEGRTVAVNVNNGSQGSGDYRIAWRDEIGAIANTGTKDVPFYVWSSKPDSILPTDSQVNEGQVTAFKDPNQDKVWVFWSSTRNGLSDLYYETISPQFYSYQAN